MVKLVGMALLIFLGACTWKSSTQPSILVILVEDLRFGAFSCGDGSDSGRPAGLRTFCDEAVRFTHAYTPSVMSQPTIASIMTAKYPFEHLVRHNGAQSLSAKDETFAEQALARGYRTAFFSGGPPIWRRSGLNQGFELFEDNVAPSLRSFYRSAPEIVRAFTSWLDTDSSRDRFAAFLYLPDLQFTDAATTNELGEVRESSRRSQLDSIDEGLSALVKEMKRRKLWDSTEIFLVGLQGEPSNGRGSDQTPMNLFSETTRATLMVKPTRKSREGPFNWKIDANVSLVDVGATLFEFIGAPRARAGGGDALVHSLSGALNSPQPDWSLERSIISESAWAQWRGLSGVRAAVRRGPYLYLFDESPALFNTLTDNPETTALPLADPRASELRAGFADFLKSYGYAAWKPLERVTLEKATLSFDLWHDREPAPETLAHLKKLATRFDDDVQLQGWRALWALRSSNWAELKAASEAPVKQPLWAYVADRNLGEKISLPDEPCFAFLKTSALPKECRLEGLPELLAWVSDATPEAARTKAMESFLRLYQTHAVAERIGEQSQQNGRTWDTALAVDAPEQIDLLLALPELKKQRVAVRAYLSK